ncbi:unnamed protein product [Alternaria alternata]
MQLLSFWQTRQEDPSLEGLFNILQPSISDTKGEISSFLEHIISRYGKRLLSNSKSNLKDVGKMLQWHMLERDNVARLQDKLRKSKEIILIVQSQANMILEEKDQSIVIERMDALADAESETARQLNERLDDLGGQVQKQGEALGLISRSIGSISSTIAPIANLVVGLPGMLAKIHAEQLSQRLLFFSLNPFAQNSAIVEDALGWKFSIPLELISSWNTLHSILVDRFSNQPGYDLVRNRRYAIRDDVSGLDILQNKPLTYVLRPGQKVNMCMVYFTGDKDTMMCPRCKRSTLRANNLVFTCPDPRCEMEIQRIEEIHDDTANNKMDSDATQPNFRTDGSIMQPDFEDEFPTDLISIFDTEEGPEVFKRVRFLSRWEFRLESRGSLFAKVGQYNWWIASCLEATAMKVNLINTLQNVSARHTWVSPGASWSERKLLFCVFFVGPTLQESRPVLVIFGMSKKVRREAWKHSIGIDWIRANPSLILLTSWHSIFHPAIKKFWEIRRGVRFLKNSWKTTAEQ